MAKTTVLLSNGKTINKLIGKADRNFTTLQPGQKYGPPIIPATFLNFNTGLDENNGRATELTGAGSYWENANGRDGASGFYKVQAQGSIQSLKVDPVTPDDYNFGTDTDFTIEMFVRSGTATTEGFATNTNNSLLTIRNTDASYSVMYASYYGIGFIDNSNGAYIGINLGEPYLVKDNISWNHLSVCRQGDTYYFAINGTIVGTNTIVGKVIGGSGSSLRIGGAGEGVGASMIGSYDDVRVTKGSALYTSSYTIPGPF